MSDDIASIKKKLWEKMRNKTYRDNFVGANVSTGIAAQLVTMRESRGWQQKEVAEKAGMAPARISVMENPSYDKFTLSTLKRLASTFDVALIVRFVPFSELVDWIAKIDPEKMNAISYEEDSILTVSGNFTTIEGGATLGKLATTAERGKIDTEPTRKEYDYLPNTGWQEADKQFATG